MVAISSRKKRSKRKTNLNILDSNRRIILLPLFLVGRKMQQQSLLFSSSGDGQVTIPTCSGVSWRYRGVCLSQSQERRLELGLISMVFDARREVANSGGASLRISWFAMSRFFLVGCLSPTHKGCWVAGDGGAAAQGGGRKCV